MDPLLQHCLLQDEQVLWHRIVSWKVQRYGKWASFLRILPLIVLLVGPLIMYLYGARTQYYFLFFFILFMASTGTLTFAHSNGLFTDAHEAVTTRRSLFIKDMSSSIYLTSVLHSSILDIREEEQLIHLIQRGKDRKATFDPLDEAEQASVIRLLREQQTKSKEEVMDLSHKQVLPPSDKAISDLPVGMQQSMLLHGDMEDALYVSSVPLWEYLWPHALYIFVGAIPGIIFGILTRENASPEDVANGSETATSDFIFVGIAIKLFVSSSLIVVAGLFGKRHFVISSSNTVYTAVTYFGNRGLFFLKRLTLPEMADRMQVHFKFVDAPRGAIRYLFPDSAISIQSDSKIELNRFPCFIHDAKQVYVWIITHAERKNLGLGPPSDFSSNGYSIDAVV